MAWFTAVLSGCHSGYTPSRGQVVVFRKQQSTFLTTELRGDSSTVVKRVLGIAGDRVRVADGAITVYNKEHASGFNPDNNQPWQNTVKPDAGRYIDVTLKDNEVFVVGDNRMESIDSRLYGPIQASQIIGIVP